MRLSIAVAACGLLAATTLEARVDPSSLRSQVGLGYRPDAADERGIWQDFDRLEQEIATSNLRVRDAALQTYVEHVLARLLGPQSADLRVYIVRDASFNASMAPNGLTIVHTGFLAHVRTEAELAAVLGHEAAHYLLRHSVTRWRDRKLKRGVMAFVSAGATVGAGISAQTGGNPGSWIDLANSINGSLFLSIFSFSREQEAEADALGLKLMSDAGYQPEAAAQVWRELIDERRASAVARGKHYIDNSRSVLSTHPPSDDRFTDMTASAQDIALTHKGGSWDDGAASWSAAIAASQGSLLEEQVKLNDPGASLFLLDVWARSGWTGALRYLQGEVYRLRDAPGDAALAADAYAKAVALPDPPAEAWRQHGYALIKAGQGQAGRDALRHYLELRPTAPDAGMVRFALSSS